MCYLNQVMYCKICAMLYLHYVKINTNSTFCFTTHVNENANSADCLSNHVTHKRINAFCVIQSKIVHNAQCTNQVKQCKISTMLFFELC